MAPCTVDSFLRARRSAAAVLSWFCHVTWVSLIPAPLFACSVMLLFALILSHFVMRCYGSVNRRFLSAGSPFCCRSVVMILSCYLSFVGFLVCPCARGFLVCPCARGFLVCPCARGFLACPCARRPVRRPISKGRAWRHLSHQTNKQCCVQATSLGTHMRMTLHAVKHSGSLANLEIARNQWGRGKIRLYISG